MPVGHSVCVSTCLPACLTTCQPPTTAITTADTISTRQDKRPDRGCCCGRRGCRSKKCANLRATLSPQKGEDECLRVCSFRAASQSCPFFALFVEVFPSASALPEPPVLPVVLEVAGGSDDGGFKVGRVKRAKKSSQSGHHQCECVFRSG